MAVHYHVLLLGAQAYHMETTTIEAEKTGMTQSNQLLINFTWSLGLLLNMAVIDQHLTPYSNPLMSSLALSSNCSLSLAMRFPYSSVLIRPSSYLFYHLTSNIHTLSDPISCSAFIGCPYFVSTTTLLVDHSLWQTITLSSQFSKSKEALFNASKCSVDCTDSS